MKIWFDLSNSPHINMFYDLIKELEREGHKIIITSRPLANTIDLLNQKGLKHTPIGKHYGKNLFYKIFGYPIRVFQLWKFLKDFKLDLAVSQSSFHSPVVAKLLNIPSIYTNDNEHAIGNMPSFLFATKILIPENLPLSNAFKNGIAKHKVIKYPGVKEGIYLWYKGEQIHKKRKLNKTNCNYIYIRPEPQTAQYYNGKQNFLDATIIGLKDKYKIIVLPRNSKQTTHYKQPKFSSVTVLDEPLSFDSIATNCLMFIGAGGSMTREFSILGIPTISVYQDEMLEVDHFLISKGLMLHTTSLTANRAEELIKNFEKKAPELELMNKGRQAYNLFKNEILKFENND